MAASHPVEAAVVGVTRLERAARLDITVYDERGRQLSGADVVLRLARHPAEEVEPSPSPRTEWGGRTDGVGRLRIDDLPVGRKLHASIYEEGRLLREIEWPLILEDDKPIAVGWIVDRGRDRSGRLTDADGEVLSGVRLWLFANEDGPFERRRPRHLSADAADRPLREVVTDERGAFELPGLQHGWYRIGPAPGFEHVALAHALEHDLRDEPTRVDLSAQCGTPVRGSVIGSDGRGLPGALVFAEQPGIAGVLTTRCDERGRFELAAPAATLRFLARDERFGFETRIVEHEPHARGLELRFE